METPERRAAIASPSRYAASCGDALFSFGKSVLPSQEFVARMWPLLEGGADASTLAQALGLDCKAVQRALAILAKINLVRLSSTGKFPLMCQPPRS